MKTLNKLVILYFIKKSIGVKIKVSQSTDCTQFQFQSRKNYTFLRMSPLLVKLQKRTVTQMKALNDLIIRYFTQKINLSENKGVTVYKLRPILISK